MYNTRQKAILIDYLKALRLPESATVIASNVREIGKSTVFRLLKQLEEDGKLQISVKGRCKLYLYKKDSCNTHLHAECTSCGRYFHLDNSKSRAIEEIITSSGLKLNDDIVLSCTCEECSK